MALRRFMLHIPDWNLLASLRFPSPFLRMRSDATSYITAAMTGTRVTGITSALAVCAIIGIA